MSEAEVGRLLRLVGNLVGVLDEVLEADEVIDNTLLDHLPSGSGPLDAVLEDARAVLAEYSARQAADS